jgi:prepilin-type N-terminal cleavage/methylation domain-containing protein
MNVTTDRCTSGFTLLEVLAAVMIFAMVVTVLIGTSSSAVNRAGLSATRLEASLIAEEEMALLESMLNTQRTPPEDKEETRDFFSIRVYSEPALDDFGGGPVGGSGGGDREGDLNGSAGAGVAALLALEAPGIDQFIRRYEIRVEWIEGAGSQTIRRTTYAFDWEGARAALPDLFQGSVTLNEGGDGDGPPDLVPEAGRAVPQP